VRGWPSTIFCTTEAKYLEDLKTRSLTITPEMSSEKYHEANKLKGRKWARPWEYENDYELEVLRECIRILIPKMRNLSVIIPYGEELGEVYYHDLPRDMRDFSKFGSFISVNTYLNMYRRVIIKANNKRYLVATKEDYEKARDILGNVIATTRTGLSSDQLMFYNHVIEDLAEEKEQRKEIKWLTYDEIIERFPKTFNRTLGRSTITEKYIKPIEKIGWIDIIEDPNDTRRRLIKPIRAKNYCVRLTEEFLSFFNENKFKLWLESLKNYFDKIKIYNGIIREAYNEEFLIDDDYIIKNFGDERKIETTYIDDGFHRNNFGDNQSPNQAPFDKKSSKNIALIDRKNFQGHKGKKEEKLVEDENTPKDQESQCGLCGKTFSSLSELVKHIKEEHKDE
ncbi:MAG: C2H2-type zinc finger protein, partial [Nitrososphaerales archaeon]